MTLLRLLLVSSSLPLLAACNSVATLPKASPPEEIPGPADTATTTATWTPTAGRSFQTIAAASAGNEAAVAYTESEAPDDDAYVLTHIMLQRLDATGALSGSPIELGAVQMSNYARPNLGLATDGDRYLSCWQREGSVACAGVPVGGGTVFPALTVQGAGTALAYGAGTFALAYAGTEQVSIVRIASDGSQVGSPTSLATGAGTQPTALLAGSESGFTLVSADLGAAADVLVHRLDGDLAPVGDATDLGMSFWFRGAVAAYGTNIAVGLAEPYGGKVFTLDSDKVTHLYSFEAGGKPGMNVALLAGAASFDMLSTHDASDLGLLHRTIQGDQVISSEQPILTEHAFDYATLAPLRLHGDLFIAWTDGPQHGAIMVAGVKQQ